jgi:hypothetical protein
MFAILGELLFYAFAFCLVIGIISIAAGAFFVIGGLFGIILGGTTSVYVFGYTLVLGVLGESAVKLGFIFILIGCFFLFMAFVFWFIAFIVLPRLQALLNTFVGSSMFLQGLNTNSNSPGTNTNSNSQGTGNPAQPVLTYLEDLRSQLVDAQTRLQDAINSGFASAIVYWQQKIASLTSQIANLGG